MEKKFHKLILGFTLQSIRRLKKFNKPGKRKILYIGNDYSYNNFAKNLNYLELLSKK